MFINVFLIWLLKKKGRYFLSIWKFNSKCICNIEKNKLVLKFILLLELLIKNWNVFIENNFIFILKEIF